MLPIYHISSQSANTLHIHKVHRPYIAKEQNKRERKTKKQANKRMNE